MPGRSRERRVLLDEQLPVELRRLLPAYDVKTVAYMGWKGLQNGALISAAEQDGFDIFVTADKNMPHQLNMTGRRIAILILSTNRIGPIKAALGSIANALGMLRPGSVALVTCGGDLRPTHSE